MFSGINIPVSVIQNSVALWLAGIFGVVIGLPFALAFIQMVFTELRDVAFGSIERASGGSVVGTKRNAAGGLTSYGGEMVSVSDKGEISIHESGTGRFPNTPEHQRAALTPSATKYEEFSHWNGSAWETVSSPLGSRRWRAGSLESNKNNVAADD